MDVVSQIHRDRNIICAAFDSADFYPVPECLPVTRELVSCKGPDYGRIAKQ